MMRRMTIPLLATLVLVALGTPSGMWASHEPPDERPTTSLEHLGESVGVWLDPWLEISGTDIADDHAPWVALGLYEVLLGIRPEPCYHDTYAAYWAVAADLRALGEAPTQEGQAVEFERVFDDVARAGDLAERDSLGCLR